MAKNIMIQGTASNSGKSFLTAGFCRLFKEDGYKTAPFKSQNMASNSFITAQGEEMGKAQAVQAEASGIEADARMNPILLKPTSDMGSELILLGKSLGHMKARDYFAYKKKLVPEIMKAYESLARDYELIVLEGAGSPVEINLQADDIVNMGMAERVDAPVILVGDIDRGGVFASLAGTLLLMTEEERARVKGVIINKFRGDLEILKPGLSMLEEIIKLPVLGVLPYLDITIEDEDSLSSPRGQTMSADPKGLIDIALIPLPRRANFAGFAVLERMEGLSLRYPDSPAKLGQPDLIIIPDTNNLFKDCLWLKERGLASAIKYYAKEKIIIAFAAGFQLLGDKILARQADGEEVSFEGLGLLNYDPGANREAKPRRIQGVFPKVGGPLNSLSGQEFSGFETTRALDDKGSFLVNEGRIYGTFVHEIFDSPEISKALISDLLEAKGLDIELSSFLSAKDFKERQYDLLASSMREFLDMDTIYKILHREI